MILSVLFHVSVSLDSVGWSFSKQRFNILKQIIMSNLMMTFICAQVHYNVDYILSVSDDWKALMFSYLSDRLATLLAKERTHSQTYIGCMKKGPVITDPKMKWYVGYQFLPSSL